MYTDLLILMLERKNFYMIEPHVKEHTVSKEVFDLLKVLAQYWVAYPGQAKVTPGELASFFYTTRIIRDAGQQRAYDELFKTMLGKPTGVIDDVLKFYMKLDTATRMANRAMEIATTGKGEIDEVTKLGTSYQADVGATLDTDSLFVSTDLTTLVRKVRSGGLRWRLECLNRGAGPIRKGDFILVAAPVETGKTTFLADQVSFMASQLSKDESVVWINNEESSDKVMFRVIQAATGWNTGDVLKNNRLASTEYAKVMGGNAKRIKIIEHAAVNRVAALDTLFMEVKPSLVVFDTLDKVGGFEKRVNSEHERLGLLYQWARVVAMQHGPVIATSQVDATGFGSRWIGMNQLRGSKVDKPGELDLIITIGKIDDLGAEFDRFIHLPKNKLFGGKGFVEADRHGKFVCIIKPEIARYADR